MSANEDHYLFLDLAQKTHIQVESARTGYQALCTKPHLDAATSVGAGLNRNGLQIVLHCPYFDVCVFGYVLT